MRSNNLSGLTLIGSSEVGSVKLDMADVVSAVKNAMGLYDKVLEKCSHCGQWGAIMCACPSCGAPIDPPVEKMEPEIEPTQYYHVHPTQYYISNRR